MTDEPPKVRPLSDGHREPDHGLPALPWVLGVLAIGAVIGWGFSAVDGTSPPAEAPTTTGVPSLSVVDPSGGVSWVEADVVPAFPEGYAYLGATDPVEAGGNLYLAVRFLDPATDTISNELWSSPDGLVWDSEPLELDEPVAVAELTAAGDALILTGTRANTVTLWRTPVGRCVEGDAWVPLNIEVPEGIHVESHATVVNEVGEVATVVTGSLAIWRDVIAPYLPEGIDPNDPELRLSGDSVHFSDRGSTVRLFAEVPEVIATGSSIWVRLVTLEGEEVMRSYDLPVGAYPLEPAPDLGCVRVGMMWTSADGTAFLPVLGDGRLPCGYFEPIPWNNGFIAAVYESGNALAPLGDARLWHSGSGRVWEPLDLQPPTDCSRSRIAGGDGLILLTGGSGARCLGTADDNWVVLDDPGVVGYSVGGPSGFIGYPKGFDYSAAMFSSDGHTWTEIPIPAPEAYPTLVSLDDCLLMISANQADPTLPKHIDIWIGQSV